ncbi:hypothetical protein [Flagellimonas sp.]|uniref:hypothetical protein n=1 Tax=Flagellimonas sp. TaxID=2058762 RepID=UPI003F4A699E
MTANLILIVSTILLIIFFTGLNSIIDSILLQHSGWTIYPPLSTEVESPEIEEEIGQIENIFEIFSKITLATQILLLILLAFCGFKTGLNYKSKQ